MPPPFFTLIAMSSKTPFFPFFFLFFFFSTLNFSFLSALPNPDPATIQSFLPTSSPPATIPAFPEQANVASCQLNLSDELFSNIKTACGSISKKNAAASNTEQQRLHRSRCCPVLAAWLYAAYSDTALGSAGRVGATAASSSSSSSSPSSLYDMPLLPDDSETCVDDFEKGMKDRGMELINPNATCGLVDCYCGIRLHPLSCPKGFWINKKGKLVGDKNVKRLERDCLVRGLGGCSKCLNSLYLLNGEKTGNSSQSEDRTSKMQNRDCQLMGLTWLLAKNRAAYIHTVSAVIRAIMMSTDGSDPQSCTLNSDGMPLAVDSSEITDLSSASSFRSSLFLCILSLSLYIRATAYYSTQF